LLSTNLHSTNNTMSSNKQTKTSSSSAQAAAPKQGIDTSGRTTRAMKAKAQQAAAEEHNNNHVPEDVTSSAVNTSQSTDNSATKSTSKARKQPGKTTTAKQDDARASEDATSSAVNTSQSTEKSSNKLTSKSRKQSSETTKTEQDSGKARKSARISNATTANTSSSSASILGKRKSSSSDASNSQQNEDSNEAIVEGSRAAKSAKLDDEIDPISNLYTKYFPNGKVLVKSNGKPEKLQEAIDKELDQWLKSERKKPFLWATQIPSASKANMSSDFKAMGFSSTEVNQLVKLKESLRVDGTMQCPAAGYGKHVEGTGVMAPKPRKPSNRGKARYEALMLFEDQGESPLQHRCTIVIITDTSSSQPGSSSTQSKATPNPTANPHPSSPNGKPTSQATPASSPTTLRPNQSAARPRQQPCKAVQWTTPSPGPGSKAGSPSGRLERSSLLPRHSQRQKQRHLSSAAAPFVERASSANQTRSQRQRPLNQHQRRLQRPKRWQQQRGRRRLLRRRR
jgi:hypothetical protein